MLNFFIQTPMLAAICKKYSSSFIAILIAFLLFSCKFNNTETAETSGKINTISVVIDDLFWKGEIGDSIRNKFASPVIGLPQEEPLFTINQYPTKLLEGFMTNSRNIIVVKKQSKSRYEIIKNEFKTPQNVIHISGKSTTEIIDTIEKHYQDIIKIMRQTEIQEFQHNIDTAIIDIKKIKRKFKIAIKAPNDYKYVMRKRKFIWLKKDFIGGNNNVLIYQVPIYKINSKSQSNIILNVIKTRDSIGKLFIKGSAKNSYMITERAYSPYLTNLKIANKKAFEIKGTWELKNDFMSGPFINYAILDKRKNRVIVMEGFCYAPSMDKRDLMFELEAIIKSVNFN